MELCGSKVQLAPPHENFISGITNPELVCMLLRFQILCQARSQGGDLNKSSLPLTENVPFLVLYLKTTGLKSSSFHHFYVERQYHNIT